jgi:hypothetical protein
VELRWVELRCLFRRQQHRIISSRRRQSSIINGIPDASLESILEFNLNVTRKTYGKRLVVPVVFTSLTVECAVIEFDYMTHDSVFPD